MIYVVAICYKRRLSWETDKPEDYGRFRYLQVIGFSRDSPQLAHEKAEAERRQQGISVRQEWHEISRTEKMIPETPHEHVLLREVKPEDEKELREIERKL